MKGKAKETAEEAKQKAQSTFDTIKVLSRPQALTSPSCSGRRLLPCSHCATVSLAAWFGLSNHAVDCGTQRFKLRCCLLCRQEKAAEATEKVKQATGMK
jgi:hypothetical protein